MPQVNLSVTSWSSLIRDTIQSCNTLQRVQVDGVTYFPHRQYVIQRRQNNPIFFFVSSCWLMSKELYINPRWQQQSFSRGGVCRWCARREGWCSQGAPRMNEPRSQTWLRWIPKCGLSKNASHSNSYFVFLASFRSGNAAQGHPDGWTHDELHQPNS